MNPTQVEGKLYNLISQYKKYFQNVLWAKRSSMNNETNIAKTQQPHENLRQDAVLLAAKILQNYKE